MKTSMKERLEAEREILFAASLSEKWKRICQYRLSEMITVSDIVGTRFRVKPDEKKVKYESIAYKCGEMLNFLLRGIAGREVPVRVRTLSNKEIPKDFDRRYIVGIYSDKEQLLGYIVFDAKPCEVEPLTNSPRAVTVGTQVTSCTFYDTQMEEHDFTLGELLDMTGYRREYVAHRLIQDALSRISKISNKEIASRGSGHEIEKLLSISDDIFGIASEMNDAVKNCFSETEGRETYEKSRRNQS